jgi:hypothetical protein
MEHNNIIAVEDENMTGVENDDAASMEFDMPDAETFMEEVTSSQKTDLQAEDSIIDTCLVPWRTLMDIDTVVTQHIPSKAIVSLTVTSGYSKEKVRKRKRRGSLQPIHPASDRAII